MYRGKKISVAMATYNGEKYIAEQLQTIISQTVPPDEIVICDDRSSDGTVDVVEGTKTFAKENGVEIVVLVNDVNLGFVRNFEKAILSATGDYIFLSDQDDIWEPTKVEEVIDVFIEFPEMELVMHECDNIDTKGCFLSDRRDFENIVFDEIVENVSFVNSFQSLPVVVSAAPAAGMAMCVSREFAIRIFPFGGGLLLLHDNWIGFCAVCDGKAVVLRRTLAHHRNHGENATGGRTDCSNLSHRIKRLKGRLDEENIVSVTGTRGFGREMVAYMERQGICNAEAYDAAMHVMKIGDALVDAFSSGRVSGARKLINLYRHDIRYKRTGWGNFAVQLLLIVRFSKKYRVAKLSGRL